jgi:hypothetical protein
VRGLEDRFRHDTGGCDLRASRPAHSHARLGLRAPRHRRCVVFVARPVSLPAPRFLLTMGCRRRLPLITLVSAYVFGFTRATDMTSTGQSIEPLEQRCATVKHRFLVALSHDVPYIVIFLPTSWFFDWTTAGSPVPVIGESGYITELWKGSNILSRAVRCHGHLLVARLSQRVSTIEC